jgi:prepilin-type processing-associated H-X9-DG protein/prepilin-type N-terminal cleavage/methylation domain-containing protein
VTPPRQTRCAFSLVELLVATAIITIFFGIFLPAVQNVREKAARMACANNLKRIGIAAYSYHDAFSRLPEGVQYNRDAQGALPGDIANGYTPLGPNWAVLLLPFLGEQSLYRSVDVAAYRKTGSDSWRTLYRQKVATYRCPADVTPEARFNGNRTYCGGSWARGNYAANAGPIVYGNGVIDGQTNYGNPGGGILPGAAVIGPNYGASVRLIEDGSENVIMFSEVLIATRKHDRRGTWALGQPGASLLAGGAVADCRGPNDGTILKAQYCDDIQGGYDDPETGMGVSSQFYNWQAQARSRHYGGVNACFADGSVRFIHDTISRRTWFIILSRNAGTRPLEDF